MNELTGDHDSPPAAESAAHAAAQNTAQQPASSATFNPFPIDAIAVAAAAAAAGASSTSAIGINDDEKERKPNVISRKALPRRTSSLKAPRGQLARAKSNERKANKLPDNAPNVTNTQQQQQQHTTVPSTTASHSSADPSNSLSVAIADVPTGRESELYSDYYDANEDGESPEGADAQPGNSGFQTPPANSGEAFGVRCPHCGGDITNSPNHRHTMDNSPQLEDEGSKTRIKELESQVRILTSKASAAVDKLADYEDELRKLKSGQGSSKQSPAVAAAGEGAGDTPAQEKPTPSAEQTDYFTTEDAKALPPVPAHPDTHDTVWKRTLPLSSSSTPTSASSSTLTRFPSFLRGRSPLTINTSSTAATPPTRRENDLAAQLKQERLKREAAEAKVTQVTSELEDLSVTLFQQANEMVAKERKDNAELAERYSKMVQSYNEVHQNYLQVQQHYTEMKQEYSEMKQEHTNMKQEQMKLQKKIRALEKRDGDKNNRLERLEKAISRIERVRVLLNTAPTTSSLRR